MRSIELTDTWQTVALSGASGIAQANSGQLYLGTTPPTAGSPGIKLVDNIPVYINAAVFSVVAVRGRGRAVLAG